MKMDVLVKEGVVFKRINSIYMRLFKTLMEAGDVIGKEMVITSAFDGKHKPSSFHYKHRALDIRTVHLTEEELEKLMEFLKENLVKLGYDVIYEKEPPHIHIEYDPKFQ